MSKYIIDSQTLKDIADAIRDKTDTNLKMKARDFAECIKNIPITVEGISKEILLGLMYRTAEHFEIPENIPDGTSKLGDGIFYNHRSLKSVVIPEGITTIGERCFYYCNGVEEFNLPQSLHSIQVEAFRYCKFKRMVFPSGMAGLSDRAFDGCTNCIEYNFSAHTGDSIPTLRNSVFPINDNTDDNVKIIVPEGLFLQWRVATNWVNYRKHITTPNNGFAILNDQYIANEGMTWGEWVASEYSKGEFTIDAYGYLYNPQGYQVTLLTEDESGGYNYHYVTYDEIIEKGKLYNIQ